MTTTLTTALVFALLFAATDSAPLKKQKPNAEIQNATATVEVEAFGASGKALDAPGIESFKSLNDSKDFAKDFHDGAAQNIPYGEYQIKAYHLGFYSETRVVAVYQKHVTIVAGLEVGHEPTGPISLYGRVVGLAPSELKTSFVKVAGVYSNASLESAIDHDGSFKMSGVRWGKSLLLVVGEDGILASRVLTYQDVMSAQPVIVEVGSKIADH